MWLAIYTLVPIVMAVGWIAQHRESTSVPPPSGLPVAIRAALLGLAGLLLSAGIALLVAPGWAARAWPWTLTPITSGAVGAWLIGLGVAAGHAWLIDDKPSLRPLGLTGTAFGLLQAVALARYGNELDWSSTSAVAYLAVLVALTAVSGWALLPRRTLAPDDSTGTTQWDVQAARADACPPRRPIDNNKEQRMNDKPHIVLVHGFWGGAAHWANVIVELNRRGYDSLHAVENPLTSLADDADRTRQMVRQIDGPVLLVGHSYGGAVITEAGDLPNVVGLVYVAAFAPDAGESLAQIGAWQAAAAVGNVEPDSDGRVWIMQDKFRESFCQDLAADEALVMAVTQKAPVGSTFADAVSEPAWKYKPNWYQVSTKDRMIHPDTERRMAERMNPRRIIELDASHASLASQPNAIVDLIDHAIDDLSAGDAPTATAASTLSTLQS